MKNLILIFSLTMLIGCNSLKKEEYKTTENDYVQAKIAFTELNNRLKEEDGRLWNYKLDGPILLINKSSRTIISNEKDDSGALRKQGKCYTGIFPENINIANTAIDWNGKRWTMVAFPLPDTKEERLDLLIHESFHRIQPLIGFNSFEEVQNAHLDTKEGRVYMKLEVEALKSALSSKTPENHIKNALIFRQYRQHLFSESKREENSLELNEGIATYTGSFLSGRNDSELKKHLIAQIDLFNEMSTFVRSFAYFTIPVYGYFMQKSDEKWNLRINKDTNLTDFVLDFYNLKHYDPDPNEIIQIGKSYNINTIIEIEKKRERKRIDLIYKYKVQFLGDSVVTIELENMSIGFNPSNLIPLDSFGTVYPNLRITDDWGILRVDSCGALMSPEFNSITISYPKDITDTLISGNGWRLKLNDQWTFKKKKTKYKVERK